MAKFGYFFGEKRTAADPNLTGLSLLTKYPFTKLINFRNYSVQRIQLAWLELHFPIKSVSIGIIFIISADGHFDLPAFPISNESIETNLLCLNLNSWGTAGVSVS